ncbi:MAG: helix-turn-helix domain-containing protein [Bacteroidia bacterium]
MKRTVFSHPILWVSLGALGNLLLICPLVISLLKYDSIMHSKPLTQVMITSYKEFLLQFHFDNLIMLFLFLSIGGIIGYLLYRLKTSLHQREKNITLEELLQMRESNKIEFKSSLRWDYRLNKTNKEIELAALKTIAAFMNTSGGTLVIGVADDAAIIGLEKDCQSLKQNQIDGFEQYLMNLISLSIGADSCKNIHIKFFQHQNKDVCAVKVNQVKAPAFVKYLQSTSFYIRTGNNTRELDIQEAFKYMKTHKKTIN